MRLASSLIALTAIVAPVGGAALAAPVVLELYTSQGCSSCPPADALLTELAGLDGVIALALHVDYWDYLGWKDTLADPLFTARQKGYALARSNRQVYTPELVVNGILSCLGSARDQVTKSIAKASTDRTPLPVSVDVREEDGMVVVDVGEGTGEGNAWLLPVRRHSQVQIHRGENAGRTETYVNVVRGLHPLGAWAGSPIRFRMPLESVRTRDADSYVAVLQTARDGKPGLILGAAKGPGL